MSKVAKIRSNNSLTIFYNGAVHTVDSTHCNYDMLTRAFDENRYDDFVKLLEPVQGDKEYAVRNEEGEKTGIEFVGDDVYYKGKPLTSHLANKIREMRRGKHDIKYLVKFLERCLLNPSFRACHELFEFLENRNLPITEDGTFLAYKAVNSQFGSKHGNNLNLIQGRLDGNNCIINEVGETIECERNEVDDERANECSKGLHVGGLQYSGPEGTYYSYGDKVVIVEVDPRDVVSVPRDANAQKVRVCKYKVVDIFSAPLPDQTTQEFDEEDDWEDDLDDDWDEGEDYINPDSLDPENQDCIKFEYDGETRYARIESKGAGCLLCVLLHRDPSYNGEKQHRNFKIEKMKMVELY